MTSKEALLELISTFYDKDLEEIKIIEKELEVLEIIKKKKVCIYSIQENDNFNDYNWELYFIYHRENASEMQLTETEFNLIKEWLND